MIFKAVIALALVLCLTYGQSTIQLPVTIRDFANRDGNLPQAHPDFDYYTGSGATTGIVATTLGQDGKPVIVNTKGVVSSFDSFNQWYNDVAEVNINIPYTLTLTETGANTGVYAYDNQQFFPIDGQGWGNDLQSYSQHNYGFTVEVHTVFTYKAGQTFDFKGDDDIWIFINNQLVIDLGGPHPALAKSVNLDTLGLTVGKDYPLDIFYAERHVDLSTLKISTSIKLKPTCLAPQWYNAQTNTCDDCVSPQVYLASSKSCGTCNAPRLYDSKTGACDACPNGSARNFDGTCISVSDCPARLQDMQDGLPICKYPCRSDQIYHVQADKCRCTCTSPFTKSVINGHQICV